jgi:thiosulfate/3-mercaptopyruvate sulfurtransferase
MKRFFLAFLLFSMAGGAAFPQKSRPSGVRTQMLVSTEWLATHLSDPKLCLIHVGQGRANYDAGHIPGARFLDYGEVVVARDGIINELPPVEKLLKVFSLVGVGDDSRIVLLSEMQGLLAARVYWTLDYLGMAEKAALLDGGLEKWKAEKRGISTADPVFQQNGFAPRLNPSILVSREVVRDVSWLAANMEASDTVLLDARQPEAFTGESKSKNLTRNGHIPGAGNVYWESTLTSREIPTLKPVPDLQAMYLQAGIVPGKKVVAYCWIGMMAAHGYFTLKYLGFDVAMYDGSFTEWEKSEGTAVVQGKDRK